MAATQDATLNLVLEFGGGTELLTSTKKTKVHAIQLPALVAPQEYKAKGISMPESTAPTTAQANGQNGAQAENGTTSAKRPTTMRDLVEYVCRDIVTERHGMLVEQDGSIRPGILVLINDADWELEGEMEYKLQDKDHICMISTLHGG